MIQTSKDLTCHIVMNGLASVRDGWYIIISGHGKVLIELNAVIIKRNRLLFWRKHITPVPFNFICSSNGECLTLPPKVQISGIACESGLMNSFELRNKDHAKWCIRGECGEDAKNFGMVFSSLVAVKYATLTIDSFSLSYPAKHF